VAVAVAAEPVEAPEVVVAAAGAAAGSETAMGAAALGAAFAGFTGERASTVLNRSAACKYKHGVRGKVQE
jgi:hypothetical protein